MKSSIPSVLPTPEQPYWCLSHTRKPSWFLLTLFLSIAVTGLQAQKLSFSCHPHEVLNSYGRTVIAACDSNIVLYMGQPIPPKLPSATAESPVRMMASNLEAGDGEAEVDINVAIDYEAGLITITPKKGFPVVDGSMPLGVLYEIIIDCKWWDENPIADSARVGFQKQILARYQTIARNLADNSVLNRGYTRPHDKEKMLLNGETAEITIAEATDNYQFAYWTTSHPEVPVVRDLPTQDVIKGCWPLDDTVLFTAWFEKVTDVQTNTEQSGPVNVRWDATNNQLIVHGLHEQAVITIYDVRGAIAYQGTVQSPQTETQLQLWPQPGIHLAVIKQGQAITTAQFLAY